ncbi:MAG: choice-of-anchor Q domain-containing protein, partial [Sedimentisphaerales bacterium]|nr:choice-of-anchor Q domain-containing protein [Sedimentisphaerales bacterium]
IPVKTGRGLVYHSKVTLVHCTVVNNGGYGLYGGLPSVTGSIIFGNKEGQILCDGGQVQYSDVQDGWPGVGNIAADPCFADPDYHLSAGSLCIDAGDPELPALAGPFDIDGQQRVVGGRIDIGMDEVAMPADQ